MEINIKFEEGDFDDMHDILFGLTGHKFTHNELEGMWNKLPQYLKDDFIHWGGDDSVVRDNIYVYYDKLLKDKKIHTLY